MATKFAPCLVEFLAFLGIPFLRQLQKFIALALVQLRVLEGEALAQLAFTQAATEAINEVIGVATLVANEVENTLGSLPLGAFQDCGDSSTVVGILRDSFSGVLDLFDEASNEANRAKVFGLAQANAAQAIDDKISYLEDLNSQIDIVILDLLRQAVQ